MSATPSIGEPPSSSGLAEGVPRVCTELQSGPREAAGPCASPHPLPAPLPVPRALGCASSLLSRKAAQASSCLGQMPLCVCLLLHLHLREKEQGPRMDKQLPRGKSAVAGKLGGRVQACCAVQAQGRSSRGRGRGRAHLSLRVSEHLSLPGWPWGGRVEAGVPGAWLHGRPCRRKRVKAHLTLASLGRRREHCHLGPPPSSKAGGLWSSLTVWP